MVASPPRTKMIPAGTCVAGTSTNTSILSSSTSEVAYKATTSVVATMMALRIRPHRNNDGGETTPKMVDTA